MKLNHWLFTAALCGGLGTAHSQAQAPAAGAVGATSTAAPTAAAAAPIATDPGAPNLAPSADIGPDAGLANTAPTNPASPLSPLTPPQTGARRQAEPPGTPDMTPTTPSRSILDTATPPDTISPRAPMSTTRPAIGAAPPTPGVSPLSGLRTADLPKVSAGTQPVDARGARTPRVGPSMPLTPPAATEPIVPAGAESLPGTLPARPTANAAAGTNILGPGVSQVVPTPPPAPLPETQSALPADRDGRTWVPGDYTWNGSRWTWYGGSWQQPPAPGATWVPGTYDAATHRWTSGHWTTGGHSIAPRDSAPPATP